ncbi:MAG TPA: ATP-binding protein [Vicinamibacteria bacterium]|nr:ATP-binding protein [Vicinamibacteria bacterium]
MAPPLGSLRSRVFVATALVAVLPITAALLFVTGRVTAQAEAELHRRLEEAVRLVGQYHRTRLEVAAERASSIADLPKLKAAVDTADAATIEPIARDYRELAPRAGGEEGVLGRADVFVVSDRARRTLVALGTRGRPWSFSPAPFRVDGDRLLETFEVPIEGIVPHEVWGWLTLGFALDDAFVGRLKGLTGSEIAVLAEGRVFASTLPRALDTALLARAPRQGMRADLDLGGEVYGAAPFLLGSDGSAPRLLVLHSRPEALRPVRTLRTAVALAALAAIVASVLLSWALARTVTRPMAALTSAMKEIAATGDLARSIAPAHPWDDEDAKVLSSTFGTLTASIARFQREAALRDRLSALGRLSTVIAHEVRNPLMVIKGSLRSLKRDHASPEVREAAADIEQQVARLDHVVGDVLDFARPLRVEPAPVDLAGLLTEAARGVSAEGVPVRVAVDTAGSIVTDGERLRAVLVNLLENARDSVLARAAADPAGSASSREIETGACPADDGRVRVWVEDHGTGIASADMPKVFEPYFTTKRTGTGLGLAIARKVVEALGGTIRIDSREGVFTRVEVELPPAPPARSMEVP